MRLSELQSGEAGSGAEPDHAMGGQPEPETLEEPESAAEPMEQTSLVDDADSEVEALARELVESGERGHDVDTPFAWTQEDPEEADGGGPPIGHYFEGLLGWRREVDS